MMRLMSLPPWLSLERVKSCLLTGLILFLASYIMDLILYWLDIPAASTLLNNFAIGILGALLLWFYLSARYESQNMARARERLVLMAELNYRIRSALTAIGQSVVLDDKEQRLRMVEQAIARIDLVLTVQAPTLGTADRPEFYLDRLN